MTYLFISLLIASLRRGIIIYNNPNPIDCWSSILQDTYQSNITKHHMFNIIYALRREDKKYPPGITNNTITDEGYENTISI